MSTADPAKIQTAIDALEAQRHVLGDDVVETALAPLKAKLAGTTDTPRVRRRQVTVMFADLSGFTTLSEHLDPEELALMLSRFWQSVDDIITEHRGNVLQHMADGVLAVWSDTAALEDDAQQAVSSALQIIERVERDGILVAGANVEATVSIGINTGPVHLRALDDFGYTTLGDTTNVAARLEGKAGAGEVWISRATYHQVRGVFDLQDVGDQMLKGREEPVRAYRVLRARPNARTGYLRGLDGAETQLVGRAAEQTLLGLRLDMLEADGSPSSMVLIGDPGIGKSRLIEYALSSIASRPDVHVVQGRALPDSANTPFALLRSGLADRFAIPDTDDPAQVLDKLVRGFSETTGRPAAPMAHSVGWLAGLVPGESGLGRDDAQFRRNAAISDFFDYVAAAVDRDRPTVVILEDLHWADGDSLDLFERLVAEHNEGLFVLASTRPTLLGDRPTWGEPGGLGDTHDPVRLEPLGHGEIDVLLAQLLAPMGTPPDLLRRRVAERCDGNPFHVEELVKMLIDDRVIETSVEPWRFDAQRLRDAKVPTTLTGVLQARLDHLSAEEFSVLQAGSVFGRYFWDHAVQALLGDHIDVDDALGRLTVAALVTPQPESRFDGTGEEAFKHDFTQVVTYDTIDIEQRPALHARAARWLEQAAVHRADELALSIATHYEQAHDSPNAATWYSRAARQAQGQSAYTEAARLFALAAQHAEPDGTDQLQLIVEQSYSLVVAGRFDEAKQLLEQLMETAEAEGLTRHWLLACTELSRIALFRDGDFVRARHLLDDGLARGEAAGHIEETLLVRHQLGNLAIVDGDFDEAIRLHSANVERADAGGQLFRRGWALNSLAHSHAQAGHSDEAQRLADETIRAADELGDPRLKMAGLAQKGLTNLNAHRWDEGLEWFEQSQRLNRRNGDPEKLATVANYLGECSAGKGDVDAAHRHFDEARAVSTRAGVRTELVRAVIGLAEVAHRRGHPDLAERSLAAASSSAAAGATARHLLQAVVERTGVTLTASDASSDTAADTESAPSATVDDAARELLRVLGPAAPM